MGKKVDLNVRRQNNHIIKKSNHNFNHYNNAENIEEESSNNPVENQTSTGLTQIGTAKREYELPDKAHLTIKLPLKVKIILVALLISIPFFMILIFVVIFGTEGDVGGSLIGFGGYYTSKCPEITVIEVDEKNGYTPIGSETYDIEDYVAGVVSAEVGGLKHIELYKVYALAARTFALRNVSSDCSIENSARKQVFKDITESNTETSKMIYEAVEETAGQVILQNGDLYPVQYDAFCYIEKNSSNYTLSQKNQQIPVEWATSHVWSKQYLNCPCNLNDKSMSECWDSKGNWTDGGHGRGMSQYGAYYLATELEYTYDEILGYYYGDEISLSSQSFITSIAGLEIKDTKNAKPLNQKLSDFLAENGSSVEHINGFIRESVEEAGISTREGVVTAAVSLINYLYDNFNTKIAYFWGGKYNNIGVNSLWGARDISDHGHLYKGFDCSGFVNWSIKNGGFNYPGDGTSTLYSKFSKYGCSISDTSCIGQPGDIILKTKFGDTPGHVQLIIAVDEESQKYFIAEAAGSNGVIMTERPMHENSRYNIINMDNYYNDPSNFNSNY